VCALLKYYHTRYFIPRSLLSTSHSCQELPFRSASFLFDPSIPSSSFASNRVLSYRLMATSQDAHSACGIDHSAHDLQPEMTQPVTSPGITVKVESNAAYSTASASSQRPATTKRKGTQDLAPDQISTNAAQPPAPRSTLQATSRNSIKRSTTKTVAETKLNSTIRTPEPVPPLQQYTQAFLQAEKKASDTVRRVSEYVKDEPEQDSESLYMHERLVAIEHPAYPAPVRVAISGNSGIRKSTLINATLGLPTLCPTVSDARQSLMLPI